MARKSKGKFDMKGHTLPGIKQVKGKMGDGRASSSPFQMKPTGDSPAQFSPFGGFGGGRPMWKSILDPAGIFRGNQNQNQGNAPVQQPGQSFAKANFEQLQQQPNPNADPNIVQPTVTPTVVDPVVDPNAGVSGPGVAPVMMKSPVKKDKKGFDYGQKHDYHKKFDYSGEPDPSHEPSVKEEDKTDHTNVPLSEHEKKKGTEVIGGSLYTEKNDLEMRISDLNSDIADKGQEGPTKTRAQVMKLEKRLAEVMKLLSTQKRG